jgi:radical SAM/Cys-rich protein
MRFEERIRRVRPEPLRSSGIGILQVNLGYRCNMSCAHCHVEAGPGRNEEMNSDTIGTVLAVLRGYEIGTLDITGGSPELNPHFRYFVEEAKAAGCHVIVRTNLTIFFEKGMEDLPEFYRSNGVEVTASLPCYTAENVDRVRGSGAFQKSINALRILNSLGYGDGSSGRRLNLVYNPAGAFLPPLQTTLEDDYRREMKKRFGVSFDHLYTFANMPIGRFRDHLVHTGAFEKYMGNLMSSFNPNTLEGLMCGHLISVRWDGMLSDCDFNQVLGIPVADAPQHIERFDYSALKDRKTAVGDHCYGCTAGQGST